MAVILRTLNVLNPAIPPINAKIRFMARPDRTHRSRSTSHFWTFIHGFEATDPW
jgi:hypothetical protein